MMTDALDAPQKNDHLWQQAEWAFKAKESIKWFWIRSALCAAAMTLTIVTLFLAADAPIIAFDMHGQTPIVIDYIATRITLALAVALVYAIAYLKTHYFSYVALAALIYTLCALLSDYFMVFIHAKAAGLLLVLVSVALQITTSLALALNFRFALRQYPNRTH